LRPDELGTLQRAKLAAMLEDVLATNAFYRAKLSHVRFNAKADPLERLPFTTRQEVEQDQLAHRPFGTNLTYPLEKYCRFHQTSGTGGRAVRWLDTPASWLWFQKCWGIILAAAGVGPGDRLLFPFSFGPFVGFWAAFESAAALGHLCIPAGGISTASRLRMIQDNGVTVVCCTPTYALRMAEVAQTEGIDLHGSTVRSLIVAGEPGGSIPETRQRIEAAWGARVFDHTGMTEIGAMTFECGPRPGAGVHVIESEFIAEVIDPKTGRSASQDPDGAQSGELVVTNLGRWGSPLIRYRTGDQVRIVRGKCDCGRWYARLEGGILGRIDDMIIVRGNNVFPPAVEAVLRGFAEVAEFRATVTQDGPLAQVTLEIEPTAEALAQTAAQAVNAAGPSGVATLAERVGRAVQDALHFRADVRTVAPGTLPRFEMKARRFVRAKPGARPAAAPAPAGT
jgi:phenylacetate-CoA ligase